ncbi:MAG: SsrA-binding protein [Candidatus Dependentiae bacterium ADurb.Bin331]|nr:MAG: SsrA-binding protein [Candidatus Dependentiae bacterium ADurb.Bin331]
MKIIAQNKKAFHDYEIIDRIEAGVVLKGDEVKSIRAGHISLVGAYATITRGELFLLNCTIAPYAQAYQKNEEIKTRTRKLLVHRRELNRLAGEISRKGVTILPLKIYLNERGIIKVELGIGKHKKMADKKLALKERDIKRETARELRGRS